MLKVGDKVKIIDRYFITNYGIFGKIEAIDYINSSYAPFLIKFDSGLS